jgi:glutaredoxin-like protein
MAFIKEKDRELLQKEFQALVQPVKLVLFVEELDCQYCRETKALLEEIAALSDKITLETYNRHVDTQQAAQFKIDKAPAIAVMNGKDYGIRYFGIPSGYEFGSLIDDIIDVSKGESGLSPATKEALAQVTQPIHFQVFVTPTCPYCPQAVRLAHKMAIENEYIRADMIEATEFPELAEKYEVMAVPRTIINETSYFEGALPEAQFVAAALQALEPISDNQVARGQTPTPADWER